MTKAREIRVCFDANAIYNESALYLLPVAVKELMQRHSSHSDVSLSWYIPSMVRGEREFRMQAAAKKLLPKVVDLETLFGVNLNITNENVREQVTRRIDQEITRVGLRVLACDSTRVDWERVFADAAGRLPPFDSLPQEKEKGFRDLVIGEAFLQLVEDSPKSKKACQIALVTNDDLLTQMVQDRSKHRENVKVLADVAAVDEYINTLASEASEEYVESLRNDAAKFFFGGANDKTVFLYTSGAGQSAFEIIEQIERQPPEGAQKVVVDSIRILPPSFVSKKGQRVTWISRISIDVRATKEQKYLEYAGAGITVTGTPELAQGLMNLGMGPLAYPSISSSVTIKPPTGLLFDASSPIKGVTVVGGSTPSSAWKTREVTVYAGQAEIEIQWAATVTTAGKKLKNAAIISTAHTKTEWHKEG